MRKGRCEWCNKIRKLTKHHVKYRHGEKIQYYNGKTIIPYIQHVCESCHIEIEDDYVLTGIVVKDVVHIMEGIRNAMNNRHHTKKWYRKKIDTVYKDALITNKFDEGALLITQLQGMINTKVYI